MIISKWVGVVLKRTVGFNSTLLLFTYRLHSWRWYRCRLPLDHCFQKPTIEGASWTKWTYTSWVWKNGGKISAWRRARTRQCVPFYTPSNIFKHVDQPFEIIQPHTAQFFMKLLNRKQCLANFFAKQKLS